MPIPGSYWKIWSKWTLIPVLWCSMLVITVRSIYRAMWPDIIFLTTGKRLSPREIAGMYYKTDGPSRWSVFCLKVYGWGNGIGWLQRSRDISSVIRLSVFQWLYLILWPWILWKIRQTGNYGKNTAGLQYRMYNPWHGGCWPIRMNDTNYLPVCWNYSGNHPAIVWGWKPWSYWVVMQTTIL